MFYSSSQLASYSDRELEQANNVFKLSRDSALLEANRLPTAEDGLALCITVYNEPADALQQSMATVKDGIEQIRATAPGMPLTVFIIVDGISKCDPTMLSLLEFYTSFKIVADPNHDLICYCSSIDLSLECISETDEDHEEKPHSLGGIIDTGERQPRRRHKVEDTGVVNIVAAVKDDNLGKLDSHWWFYKIFCPISNPTYCLQMDVGTTAAKQTFLQLISEFKKGPRIGAVASSIFPSKPERFWELLYCWQYSSFSNAMLLEWPAEVIAGFLSVVPGQMSAFRWHAIRDAKVGETDLKKSNPLDVYFKGLGALTPAESMLYLAEDRVLCRELVTSPHVEWTVAYTDQALAITDPCHSWKELLLQRKRWYNGYVACRVNYLIRLPNFLCNPFVSKPRKIRAATAGIYHSAALLVDWFIVTLSTSFIYFSAESAIILLSRHPVLQSALDKLLDVTIIVFLFQFFLLYLGKISRFSINVLRSSIGLQCALVILSILVNIAFTKSSCLISLIAFLLLIGPVASLCTQKHATSTLLRIAPIATLASCIVPSILYTFAFCNVHDCSWGTKGLTKDRIQTEHPNLDKRPIADNYKSFRNKYFSIWLGSNLVTAAIFSFYYRDNPFDATITLIKMSAGAMFIGLVCLIRKHISTYKHEQ